MLALRKVERRAGALALVDQPVPKPGPEDVVLKVAACGVCGSDLHAYNDDPGYEFVRVPVTLGHEFAGIVTAVGERVSGWSAGQAACAIAIQGCGDCPGCRRGDTHLCSRRLVQGLHYDGGMAEYVRVPARFLVPLPPSLDPVLGALVEPVSVALHAVFDRTRITPGDRVAVTGPGFIGLMCALAAWLCGAEVTVVGAPADRDVRLRAAEAMGFRTAVADEQPLTGLLGGPADVLIEASGSAAALGEALTAVRRGGQVTLVGLYARPASLFMTTAVRDELTLRGAYASSHPNYVRAIQLLEAGLLPVEPLLSRYALNRGQAAFEDALARRTLKPVLVP